jgi:phenylacetate-CoA ligase
MDSAALLIRNVLYPLWTVRNRSHRLSDLAALRESQYWPAERIRAEQFEQFRRMVGFAYEQCDFYRRKYDAAGFNPADLRSVADVARVPSITKTEIQQFASEMIARDKRGSKDLLADMTGGSTGSPLRFFYDNRRLDSRIAATLRHNEWAGWHLGGRAAVLWGAPRDIIASDFKSRVRSWILERRLVLDASSLTEESMRSFARKLASYRPEVLLAYANTLGLFARFVEAEGLKLPSPRGIITSAEVLTPENRALIERVLGAPVYDRYGSREFAVIASECDQHSGLHVNAENLLVEITGDTPDESGEIAVTDLKNFAMPMIRYMTRDHGRMTGKTCACGRGLPLLQLTGGRTTDFLHGSNGRRVSGIVLATYVITNNKGIGQVQFVQSQRGRMQVNVVKSPAWSEQSTADLLAKAANFLGADMNFEVVYLPAIPHEKSGKYRFSICTIDDGTPK